MIARGAARELHRSDRIGWLRAAVLGANDGIESTASLVLGVAGQLMARDAISAHARDELGLSPAAAARPMQAAWASAASFSLGAALPIGVVLLATAAHLIAWVSVTVLLFLAGLGAVSASVGGAGMARGAWRVAFWGALAMGVTAGAGALFGAVA